MKQENNLYHFESYDEIRAYLQNGFPQWIFLTTICGVVVKGELIATDDNENHGKFAPDWEVKAGTVHTPESTCRILGHLEDFPATDYAVTQFYRPVRCSANTMLLALYRVARHLAKNLKTIETFDTSFTVNKLASSEAPQLKWTEETSSIIYCIETPSASYKVAATSLFNVVARAEKAEGITTQRSLRLEISSADPDDREILARLSFSMDKSIPKLKNFIDEDEIRRVMSKPAIELSTGIIIATDGRILAAHKTADYNCELLNMKRIKKCAAQKPTDKDIRVNIPVEVLKMKGTISVTIASLKTEKRLIITATDTSGAYGSTEQESYYPNWTLVIPPTVAPAIDINAKAIVSATKQMMPNLNKDFPAVKLLALRGAKTLTLEGDDIHSGNSVATEVPVKPLKAGLAYCLQAKRLLKVLSLNPSIMHVTSPDRAIVFLTTDTLMLLMPVMYESLPDGDYYALPSDLHPFNLHSWIKRPATPPTAARPVRCSAAATPSSPRPAATPTPVPSIIEELQSLLREITSHNS